MDLAEAEKLAKGLMQQHGLSGWEFKWDRAKKRLGCCNYTRKRISLSAFQTRVRGEMEVKDTILHEIAHALLPPRSGHGKLWKAKCVEIGAKPVRCAVVVVGVGRGKARGARRLFGVLKGLFVGG
jgi:SprT-like family